VRLLVLPADHAIAVGATWKSDFLHASSSRGPRPGDHAIKPDLTATGADPLADFLLERKEGHCEYFASALAVMLRAQGFGEYYGVQGTTWKDPPILRHPHRTVRRGGRELQVYYDGRRVRLVAWRTKQAVYWVSNTLTKQLGEAQLRRGLLVAPRALQHVQICHSPEKQL
jgi:hypothetical protein